jgi:hypothetical protein
MAKHRVTQMRSGEGWTLTDVSNLDASILASEMSDLAQGVLLVATEEFEAQSPSGGEQVEAHLYAFRGDAIKTMLRDCKRWGSRRAIFALLPVLPDEDARRRWISHSTRPWDPERLKATAYGQLGADWAVRGLWFAKEHDRARFVEASIAKLLREHGVARLPNGDVTIVLELPMDSSFEALFAVTGSGESLVLERDFPSRMMSRRSFIRRGGWEGEERKSGKRSDVSLKYRLTQGLVSAAIVVVSLPMFAMVALVALITKLTGGSTDVSSTQPRRAD